MPSQDDSRSRHDVSPVGILRRMICALSLLPVVAAAGIIGADLCERCVNAPSFDTLRWFHLIVPTLLVLCSILVWRSVIIWTQGRRFLTAVVSLVPFVQVLFGKPLWDAGCVMRDVLRAGQGQFSIGVWVWLIVWVWWGWERYGVRTKLPQALIRRIRMTHNIRLVVASIGTIPFVVGFFFIIAAVFDDLLGISTPFLPALAYLVSASVAVVVWVVIWRKKLDWTRNVAWRTLMSAALLLGIPIAGTLLADQVRSAAATTLYFLPVIGWGIWMAATMWLWPWRVSGPSFSEDGPACLKCGYLLKGLTKTRCPECGAEPTLDVLWAATCADAW
jgi:hypothetical protein